MARRDEDAVRATADLARRAGAIEFRVEFSNVAPATKWFAKATFRNPSGNEPIVKSAGGTSPVYACDRLAIELLDGSVCRHCRHAVTVYGGDNTFCRWRRVGDKWHSGCGRPIDHSIKMRARV